MQRASKRRQQVLERDAHRCLYCDEPATTVDHVLPLSKGGTWRLSNLVAACECCNNKKANHLLEVFLVREIVYLQSRGQKISAILLRVREVTGEPEGQQTAPMAIRVLVRDGEQCQFCKSLADGVVRMGTATNEEIMDVYRACCYVCRQWLGVRRVKQRRYILQRVIHGRAE